MKSSKSDSDKIMFLSKPENIDIAFEVHEKFPEVRKRLQDEFWTRTRGMIEEKVRESPAKFEGWVCPPKKWQSDENNFDVGLAPVKRTATPYCYLCLAQTTAKDKFRLRYGIYLAQDDESNRHPISEEALPRFMKLRTYLGEHEFVRKEEWWIGNKLLEERLYDRRILNELSRPEEMTRIRVRVGELIGLFMETRQMMEELNSALAM
jgi:hypothetical protein